MFITPSFKKSLIVEQFQGNYLKCHTLHLKEQMRKVDSVSSQRGLFQTFNFLLL